MNLFRVSERKSFNTLGVRDEKPIQEIEFVRKVGSRKEDRIIVKKGFLITIKRNYFTHYTADYTIIPVSPNDQDEYLVVKIYKKALTGDSKKSHDYLDVRRFTGNDKTIYFIDATDFQSNHMNKLVKVINPNKDKEVIQNLKNNDPDYIEDVRKEMSRVNGKEVYGRGDVLKFKPNALFLKYDLSCHENTTELHKFHFIEILELEKHEKKSIYYKFKFYGPWAKEKAWSGSGSDNHIEKLRVSVVEDKTIFTKIGKLNGREPEYDFKKYDDGKHKNKRQSIFSLTVNSDNEPLIVF